MLVTFIYVIYLIPSDAQKEYVGVISSAVVIKIEARALSNMTKTFRFRESNRQESEQGI